VESVLAKATPDFIVPEPFPHIVLPRAVEDGVCARLIEEFPPLDLIAKGQGAKSNRRFDHRAFEALDDPRISPLWRETLAAHVSQAFLDQALQLFAGTIRQTYPRFEREFGELAGLRAGVRRVDTFESADVLLDAQISLNTPVTTAPTSVRAGHLDSHTKLFVGLLYLRHPDDDSTGGDLELYRYATKHPRFDGTPRYSAIEADQIELVQTVPFEANILVFFMNSFQALHGVTPRSRTDVPRLFMNLIAEVREPLFEVPVRAPATPPRRSMATSAPPRRRSSWRARLGVLAPAAISLMLLAAWLAKAVAHHDYDLI
jgi:hypothetical protein